MKIIAGLGNPGKEYENTNRDRTVFRAVPITVPSH